MTTPSDRISVRLLHASLLLAMACSSATGDAAQAPQLASAPDAPTFWQDMVPLFVDHCVPCHREGGIAPMRLDDYATAARFAPQIAALTRARIMPPWATTSDGSCGEFRDSLALDPDEIARIERWVQAGALAGEPRQLTLPKPIALEPTVQLQTPLFTPEAQRTPEAEHDEYRCFLLQASDRDLSFITGYEVIPGRAELVHHVVVDLLDPAAPAEDGSGRSNAQLLHALDAASPDRAGWPCYGSVGDGLAVESSPIVWAPGQGVVSYPDGSGVPLARGHLVVAQVHYNLEDASLRGASDQTVLRLRLAPRVENVGLFLLLDPLLDSRESATPISLAAGQAATTYTWSLSGADLEIPEDTQLQLRGVMPHMHARGRKYRFMFSSQGEEPVCAADIQRWDFHWQRMYFYSQPLSLGRSSRLSVTCEYDTTGASAPVLPGWGTQNEMCLATLYATLPYSQVFE